MLRGVAIMLSAFVAARGPGCAAPPAARTAIPGATVRGDAFAAYRQWTTPWGYVPKPILDEIAVLEADHEWAGVYRFGSQGGGLRLWVAPLAGIGYVRDAGCFPGAYSGTASIVGVDDDTVRTGAVVAVRGDSASGPAAEYLRIRWAGRQYLIPPAEMAYFCRDIRAGYTHAIDSRYLLRDADRAKPLSGLPVVPEAYRALLPAERVCGRVVSIERVLGWHDPDAHRGRMFFEVTLDVGTRNGIEEGGTLVRVGWKKPTVAGVIESGAGTCRVRFAEDYQLGDESPAPVIGESFSSIFYGPARAEAAPIGTGAGEIP